MRKKVNPTGRKNVQRDFFRTHGGIKVSPDSETLEISLRRLVFSIFLPLSAVLSYQIDQINCDVCYFGRLLRRKF